MRLMNTDIVSLRLLLVTHEASLQSLLRQGVAQVSVPTEVNAVGKAVEAKALIAQGADLLLLDSAIPAAEKAVICEIARAAKERPFIIAVGRDDERSGVDGSVNRPATAGEAQKILDGCVRSRLATRVLVVDDSPTMCGIIRKILSASKFPLQVSDTQDGLKALVALRSGNYDLVFLDYNMPEFDGFEMLSELRRSQSHVAVVMITSTDTPTFAERALAAGAAAFLRKPFFPADVDAVLYRLYKIDAPVE